MDLAVTRLLKCITLLLGTALVGSANADIIDIISEEGTSCVYEDGYTGGSPTDCTTVEIVAHDAWQDENPEGRGAVWVSYDETGIDGDVVAPTDGDDPIFTIVESFEIASDGTLDFWIWADDTADLFFNVSGEDLDEIFQHNLSQGTCAAGKIGCEPHEGYNMVLDLGPGSYDITMSIWQIGTGTTNPSNPFGVLYSGSVVTSVPEPGTLALLGLGLLGIGASRRRRV